jgi:hypothetical protein
MIGSQVLQKPNGKILGYINIGKEEGAVLSGGSAGNHEGDTITDIIFNQPF